MLLLLVTYLFAPLAMANAITGISYTGLPGDRVLLRVELSEPLSAEPRSFATENPARLALDFPDTTLALEQRSGRIGVGAAERYAAVEAGGRTRLVLNLVRKVPYEVKVEGNSVLINVDAPGASAVRTEMAGAGAGEIEAIDFRRGANGAGVVVVKLSDPTATVDVGEEAGKIVVEFPNTRLPEALDRKLDVTDFATPVTEVDVTPSDGGARMVISPTGEYEHLVYQADNLLTIEVKPLTRAEKEALKRARKQYTGQRLSLNFQNIEVRAVLQLLADVAGKNLVASDTVGGNVTLRLKNVPWDQAMDIILKAKGLSKRENGNVIMVAPSEEIAAREKLELEAQKQIAELAPLRTEYIQINYAKAAELAALIKSKDNNLLSERGSITIDDRTNTLLVQDTADKISDIRAMIAKLDVPVRQVLIESRIVIAKDTFSKDLGVRFGYSKHTGQTAQSTGDFFGALGGKRPGDVNFGGTTTFHTNNLENYIVDLPTSVTPAGALGLAIGKIGTWLLQLELSAAQAEGKTETISNPRVITANQKEAVIEQGTEIPYQEAASSGATSVSFKKAVLGLRVTPQITPDDRVIMDLTVSKDAVGDVFAGVPSIDTQSITTQVLVDNGETVVLGGIYTLDKSKQIDRVPFFSDLPYFGWLFRRTSDKNNKDELLIFITPKILKEGLKI
ncbi:MAG: type IV pilus secretin PilQ [Gammaproteobacteria bacterium]|nr:MAG: type IV pilus secretin PilQ [Gammaproteobacteria bacterium]